MTRPINRLRFLLLFAPFFLAASLAKAETQELRLGYVFDTWTSNFLVRGNESRVPVAYRLSSGNFGLRVGTAFVLGDYVRDASSFSPATGYKGNGFTDVELGTSLKLSMGEGISSTLTGNLNIPTGDTKWEAKQEPASVPFIFEPVFYHGRGWGGSVLYSFDFSSGDVQTGLGAGFVMTGVLKSEEGVGSDFRPGDAILLTGKLGIPLSTSDKLLLRGAHSFPMDSNDILNGIRFRAAQTTLLSGQWSTRVGMADLAVNTSYTVFGKGASTDPISLALVEEPYKFLGDRLEVHPWLGYRAGSKVELRTGLVWKWVLPNGYQGSDPNYSAGGHLLGLEQGMNIKIDETLSWSLAGRYHNVTHEKAALDSSLNPTSVNYQRFTVGTSVGVQW